jgi:hypothetical protein
MAIGPVMIGRPCPPWPVQYIGLGINLYLD